MKRLTKILVGLGLSLCLISGAVASERYALVVGNGDYEFSPLKNPTNDAADMAVALRQVGFSVRHLENVSRKDLRQAIREFRRDLSEGDVGLFYYSGHGVQSNGENFLIPIGADIQEEYEIEGEAIGLQTVLGAMEASGSRLNIVVLDACRNNPFPSAFRSASRGLSIVHAPTGTIVAFSTAPGQVAEDGTGRNSAYTKHLVAALKTPNLPIEQVFKQVRVAVGKDTDGAQTPWEESSLMGDFYFAEEASEEPKQTATVTPITTQPDQSAEVAFWQSIEDSDDPDEIGEYLKTFPQGTYAGLAKLKLKKLEAATAEKKTDQTEMAFWDTIKDSDDPDMLEVYLEEYPDGKFQGLAKIKLKKLESAATAEAQTSQSSTEGCPAGTKQTYKGCEALSGSDANAKALAEAQAKAIAAAEDKAKAKTKTKAKVDTKTKTTADAKAKSDAKAKAKAKAKTKEKADAKADAKSSKGGSTLGTPGGSYQVDEGAVCREFTTTKIVGGEKQQGYATACQQSDGSWKIIN